VGDSEVTDSTSEPCADPERLAAFIEGVLAPQQRAEVARHLSRCAACRSVVESVAGSDHAPKVVWFSRRAVFALAAGVIIVAGGILLVRTYTTGRAGGLKRLAGAMPLTARVIEPRLTRFPWAPLDRVRGLGGGRKSPEELRIAGVAGTALQGIGDDRRPDALHVAGVAHVLKNEAPEAIAILKDAAARSPRDATVWNDLAAALYSDATARDDNAMLREALADADRAIRLDPRLPEPYFNRALILERIGTRRDAAAAWLSFLNVDDSSGWAAEARKHLDDASRPPR
jgi:hypothetical protein